MRFALVLLLLLAVLFVLLGTQPANLENEVSLALPFVQQNWTGAVLWMIAGWFGVGLLLGYLVALPGRVGASMRARKVEKQLATHATAPTVTATPAARSAPATRSTTEADEMQRLADEVARRTESVQRDNPPPAAP